MYTPLTDANPYAVDETDGAQSKKLRMLEEKFKKAEDSNKALRATIKSLKRPALASDDDEDFCSEDSRDNTSGHSSDSDFAQTSDDPASLFSSRKVFA
jgi:hypothetical protein